MVPSTAAPGRNAQSMSPSPRQARISSEVPARTVSRTPRFSRMKPDSTLGTRLAVAVWKAPMRSSGRPPAPCCTDAMALADSRSSSRQCGSSASPALVRLTPRLCRRSSATPTQASSWARRVETLDCTVPSDTAAPEMLWACATARK